MNNYPRLEYKCKTCKQYFKLIYSTGYSWDMLDDNGKIIRTIKIFDVIQKCPNCINSKVYPLNKGQEK